jgi:hypothetical protein
VINISMFETKGDLRQGDEVLNAMDTPVPTATGRRTSVEFYEVGAQIHG